jgi:hypothetical protein
MHLRQQMSWRRDGPDFSRLGRPCGFTHSCATPHSGHIAYRCNVFSDATPTHQRAVAHSCADLLYVRAHVSAPVDQYYSRLTVTGQRRHRSCPLAIAAPQQKCLTAASRAVRPSKLSGKANEARHWRFAPARRRDSGPPGLGYGDVERADPCGFVRRPSPQCRGDQSQGIVSQAAPGDHAKCTDLASSSDAVETHSV